MSGPKRFRIEVGGRVSDRMLAAHVPDFAITTTATTTILTGPIRDAAHLHGVVTNLYAIGLELVSVSPTGGRPRPTRPEQEA